MYKPGLGWFWIKVWCSLLLGQKWCPTLLVMKIRLRQEVKHIRGPILFFTLLSYNFSLTIFLKIIKVIKGKDFYIYVLRVQKMQKVLFEKCQKFEFFLVMGQSKRLLVKENKNFDMHHPIN
jgi:hypothetical protein